MKEGLSNRKTNKIHLRVKNMDSELAISISRRKPGRIELERINDIIKFAIDTWLLPERVKRISLPLYLYEAEDLLHMQFLVAEGADVGIVGLAALEEFDSTEFVDLGRTMLVHGLYVDPLYHSRGIGTCLVESAELNAREIGFNGLLVKAQVDAVSFFKDIGFIKLPVNDISRDYVHRYWKTVQA